MLILGITLIVVFYSLILVMGICVSRRENSAESKSKMISAEKSLGLLVGVLSLTATEVGGAFITGTAEAVYTRGLLWAIAPIGYSLSMTINGAFFVRKLRDRKHVTLIDSLQLAYGRGLGAAIYFPSCVGDVCWTAAILSALGSTLEIVLGVSRAVSVPVSALVVVTYTYLGGMYSVAYTDTVQVAFMFCGLFLVLPSICTSERVDWKAADHKDWLGIVEPKSALEFIDTWLLVVLGGIPWQPYYQRALAMTSNRGAFLLSFIATVCSLLCMVPPVVIGVAARTVEWNSTEIGRLDFKAEDVLPALIRLETPPLLSYISLAAIRYKQLYFSYIFNANSSFSL